MGLEIPDELEPVAALVVYKWPETDETGLRGAADTWDQMADLLDQVNDLGSDVVKVVLANTQGDTHDAIENFWNKAGGDTGMLGELSEFCRELAFVLRVMAALVLAVKLFIIAMLVYLAVQLAAAAAAAVPSLGTSTAVGAAAQVSTRVAVTTALRQLIQDITAKTIVLGAVTGLGTSSAIEVGFQSLEIKLGVREGYDWTQVGSVAAHGAIKGAVAAPVKQILKNAGVQLPGDSVIGGDHVGPSALISKMIGKKVADVAWGEEPGIAGRGTEVATKVIRQEIVDALAESSTLNQGSSLDLPQQN
ncbi:hypothetical protein OG225_21580 [Nocardia sp. NBC_01377]|uniref:WXG100-like domain-containing protein n=1 Tax=Nocardia sp. NBC_01377 TaxID=2903595 RepID=UPI00324720E9